MLVLVPKVIHTFCNGMVSWCKVNIFFVSDAVSGKLQNNNIYTIAKRNVEGQDMLYQSLKLTNGIWILAELRIQPGNPNYTVQCWVVYGESCSNVMLPFVFEYLFEHVFILTETLYINEHQKQT